MSTEILNKVKKYPGQKVKLAVVDIDGVLRGKIIHIDKFLSAVESGIGFCNVVFGWDINDLAYDNCKYSGWHNGYPDALAKIDLDTFRNVPWDNDIPFFLADFWENDKKTLSVCPRNLLKKIKKYSQDLGFEPFFSGEYEWFNFAENSHDLHQREFRNLNPLTKGMFGYSIHRAVQHKEFFNDIFDKLKLFNVPVEGLHTETGPGVYEAAIIYSDIVEAADRATLFKSSLKEIAHPYGIIPSFMAKWNENLPGCSGHIHHSLWKKNVNAFYDEKDEFKMSTIMKSCIAGQLKLLPEITPFLAPTINSYKRLVEGAWAPTTLTWGVDNRTVGIRAIPGSKKSTRIEMRVSGSDANPYLAMAATLGAGLYGIENKLKLTTPRTKGNGYKETQYGTLPRNLYEATQLMKDSKIVNEIFGEEFVQHFAATREWEWRQFNQKVTDWELKRYFEIV